MPARYRLRVDGHLDDHWSAWFGGLTLTRRSDGTTSLDAAVPDQAGLHGLLTRTRDLGVTLLSVQVVDLPGEDVMDAGQARTTASGRLARPVPG